MAENSGKSKRIVVCKDGPYLVDGDIPVVRKTQVVTEHGEPVAWKKEAVLRDHGPYELCRCGHSHEKPFCDGTHCEIFFDGTETADPRPTVERQVVLQGGQKIIVKRDYSLCMEAGFCGNRFKNLEKLVEECGDDTNILAEIIGMVEHCPSGSYTYRFAENGPDVEPDLPEQIAVTTEMTDTGPIMGPLWVTGNIPIERSDGIPFETRNRVTLCNCGASCMKPLCDGTHRHEHVVEK